VHRHSSAQTLDDPDQSRRPGPAPGHEVDQPDGAVRSLEIRLEDQSPGLVTAGGAADVRGGCEKPSSVVRGAEQRGEARRGIEMWQARPVHGTVAPDQRRRLKITDESVVFDAHAETPLGCLG